MGRKILLVTTDQSRCDTLACSLDRLLLDKPVDGRKLAVDRLFDPSIDP